jgi:hypothetical protein
MKLSQFFLPVITLFGSTKASENIQNTAKCKNSNLLFFFKANPNGKLIFKRCSDLGIESCGIGAVKTACPKMCDMCDKCEDIKTRFKPEDWKGKLVFGDYSKNCKWVRQSPLDRCSKPGIADICRRTCSSCYDLEECIEKYTLSYVKQEKLGNGVCESGDQNTFECGYDGGDCLVYNKAYPECDAVEPKYIGDGTCDIMYNTNKCNFDGGDCDLFLDTYPKCNVAYPHNIGNNVCSGAEYNTPECGFYGGDCLEFNKMYPGCKAEHPGLVGDGDCHGGDYNTEECGYDGGDCEEFNAKFPGCNVPTPSNLGDGVCDGGEYNTIECRFDDNDCDKFNDKFAGCIVDDITKVGNNYCDGGDYNSVICEHDGGDCDKFNKKYPECKVEHPEWVGDNACDDNRDGYYSLECGFDGGDCWTEFDTGLALPLEDF